MNTIKNIASHISQRPAGSIKVLERYAEDQVFETIALSLSRDGMTVQRSGLHPAVGKHVWLEFEVGPYGRPICALAETRAIHGHEVRFRFLHMWPKDERRYFSYLSQACAA